MRRRKAAAMPAAVVAFALALGGPVAAPAADGTGATREVIAQIDVPTGTSATGETLAWCGFENSLQSEWEGVFGFIVPLLEVEGDGRHTFTLIDSLMGFKLLLPTNFDVAYFDRAGSCDPYGPRFPAPLARFSSLGNEQGTIPAGARWAVITMADGLIVPFIFTIEEGA